MNLARKELYPKLGTLEDNGGPTNTHALDKGSPARNAGGDPFPATDQRGVSRYQGTANDIGACERKQVSNFFTTGSGTTDSIDSFRFSDKTLTARQVKGMIV